MISFADSVHLLLLFPSAAALRTKPLASSEKSAEEKSPHFRHFQELDVITPYVPAVLVLRDVIQCQLISFSDRLPRCWIIVILAISKIGHTACQRKKGRSEPDVR
jgi:hypothetical protein